MTFCKPDVLKPDVSDVLKPDVLKPDVLKPDVLKPDVLWVYRKKEYTPFLAESKYELSIRGLAQLVDEKSN